jgi:hypothetical protein
MEEFEGRGTHVGPPQAPTWPRRLGGTGRGGHRTDLTPMGERVGLLRRQAELLWACATIRPINARHMVRVHLGELRMELAHGPRRPLRRALSLPAAGAGDEPARLSVHKLPMQ